MNLDKKKNESSISGVFSFNSFDKKNNNLLELINNKENNNIEYLKNIKVIIEKIQKELKINDKIQDYSNYSINKNLREILIQCNNIYLFLIDNK